MKLRTIDTKSAALIPVREHISLPDGSQSEIWVEALGSQSPEYKEAERRLADWNRELAKQGKKPDYDENEARVRKMFAACVTSWSELEDEDDKPIAVPDDKKKRAEVADKLMSDYPLFYDAVVRAVTKDAERLGKHNEISTPTRSKKAG